ncbi:MAG: TonB-dependent siderophore receptor [Iphinoe sp. HA4291-MV1]|jgi:iron complex outermembrane receptor protein|nr:TonB-dependent siderophore receptor [Iphinoe sp. HA4291-MV1]
MKLEQCVPSLLLTSAIVVLVTTPTRSEEILSIEVRKSTASADTTQRTPVLTKARLVEPIQQIRRVSEIEHPAKSAQMLLVQSPTPSSEVVQVTSVKANPTNIGVEIILQTSKGQQLQLVNRSSGNSFIADIPNAQLRLPSGDAFTFRSDKPIAGVTEITVTNFDANTIRVTVRGEAGLPTVELFDSPNEGLIFSVASAASRAQQPQTQPTPEQEQPGNQTQPIQPSASGDEPIELVVTGQQEGYSAPDATTATKTDTPSRDIPQSIQVIPRQVIQDQQVTRISDALRNVSGVTKQGGYGDSQDNYNIRGFSTQINLMNGFRVRAPITTPANIERIEVLKGPASVLYGQLEPGGIVNYVTKQPLDYPYYSGEFTVGSYDYYRPSIDFSGPLTADGKLLYRLNAAYETAGDFVDFVDSKTFAIAPVLTYKFSDATTLTLVYEYINTDRVYNDGLPPDPIVFKLPISRFLGEPDINRFRQEANNLYVTLNHQFSDNLQLRTGFAAAFSDTKVRSLRPLSIDADGRTALRSFVPSDNIIYSGYTVQTDLIGKFNTGSIKHQVLLGFAWDQYTFDDPGYFSVTGTPLDIFNPVYGSPQPTDIPGSLYKEGFDQFGVYLQDQVTLLPNLKLLLGGRVDFIHSRSFSQDLDSAGNRIGEPSESRSYDNPFSPRAGIVYQPIEPISLYFSYSQSFIPNSSRTVDGSLLPPERGTQYEVGIKAELIKDRLSATFAAYDITKENVATTDPNPDNSEFSIAAGEVKSRGLEFDISGQILPGWNVIASYFVNDAFVSKDNRLPVGNSLVNAPNAGGSLWTTYEIQSGGMKGLGFGGGVFYTGEREAQLRNTFKIPSYVRADASISYKRDNWKVGLNFKNLFGTKYYDSQGFFLRPGAPFTVLGTFSVEF